jgi:SH3 domain-containing YSC84-like protein 1
MSKPFTLTTALLFVCMLGTNAFAATFDELDGRMASCNLVLRNALEMPDSGIPGDLLHRCRGLAIFPGVIRLGLLVGASYGSGVVLRKDENTQAWSKPTFFIIKGGSLGVQIGAQATDLILLFMSEESVERLLEERFILGADISVSAGPVGREASAETNLKFESGILSYSRSRGLFAGLALNGASLQPDALANETYHGTGVTVQDVLYEGKGALSENARLMLKTLEVVTR